MLEFQRTSVKMRNFKNLKKSKYFKELDDQNLLAFMRCVNVQIKDFYKDETIVSDGDSTELIYIIFSGKARSYTLDINGNRYINSDYGKDSIFGIDYQMARGKVYHEYLKALDDTTVIVCNAFRFLNPCQNRCKRHIDSLRCTIEELGKEIIDSKKRMNFMCKNKTREKVMSYLHTIKAQTKKEYFSIPHNRQELADYLGLERTALSAELSKMKKEGLIDFDKNYFKILKNN